MRVRISSPLCPLSSLKNCTILYWRTLRTHNRRAEMRSSRVLIYKSYVYNFVYVITKLARYVCFSSFFFFTLLLIKGANWFELILLCVFRAQITSRAESVFSFVYSRWSIIELRHIRFFIITPVRIENNKSRLDVVSRFRAIFLFSSNFNNSR